MEHTPPIDFPRKIETNGVGGEIVNDTFNDSSF